MRISHNEKETYYFKGSKELLWLMKQYIETSVTFDN